MTDLATNPFVWVEIPVTNLDKSVAFYQTVFGLALTIDTNGPAPMALFPSQTGTGAGGHLYVGKPAKDGQGPTTHISVQGTVEDAIARCGAAGGTTLGPIIEIPSGRFAYAQDLDGNSIGLFEAST